jgi:hypothetical protein
MDCVLVLVLSFEETLEGRDNASSRSDTGWSYDLGVELVLESAVKFVASDLLEDSFKSFECGLVRQGDGLCGKC